MDRGHGRIFGFLRSFPFSPPNVRFPSPTANIFTGRNEYLLFEGIFQARATAINKAHFRLIRIKINIYVVSFVSVFFFLSSSVSSSSTGSGSDLFISLTFIREFVWFERERGIR